MSKKVGRYKDKPQKLAKFQQKQRDNSHKVDVADELSKNDVPGWITGQSPFTQEDNPHCLASESSFVILFPEYREPYLQQIWPLVEATLSVHPYLLKTTLDPKAGKMFISTTEKTFDPFIIVKGRDMLQLMARGVSLQQARRVLQDGVFSDIIKIGNLCKNRETFIRRRQRLLGPDGATLKALELLTDSYIFIQGKTVSVIGDVKSLKAVRRVVEDCMFNVHPIYHVKELMIRRELMKKPELASENWDKYLPQFKKNITAKRIKKKKKINKQHKPYTPFPNPPEQSKLDKEIESGEYFLTQEQRKSKKDGELRDKQKAKSMEKKVERSKILIAPEESSKHDKQKEPSNQDSIVDKIKTNSNSNKRKIDHKTMDARDFVDNVPKKRQRT